MPICTVQLVRLRPSTAIANFLSSLPTSPAERPLVTSRVIRWVIRPESITLDPLLSQQWDLLVIFPGTKGISDSTRATTSALYTLQVGVPSALTKNFHDKNGRLLHPDPSSVPELTGALEKPRLAESAQSLELTTSLRSWLEDFYENQSKGAISMLNLLAFKPGMHAEYQTYGKAFAESIGSRRGGNAKIVGRVTGTEVEGAGAWDEVALAHYPSVLHFADMAASEDYQAVNKKYRLPSLKDTCILCTSELLLPDAGKARL